MRLALLVGVISFGGGGMLVVLTSSRSPPAPGALPAGTFEPETATTAASEATPATVATAATAATAAFEPETATTAARSQSSLASLPEVASSTASDLAPVPPRAKTRRTREIAHARGAAEDPSAVLTATPPPLPAPSEAATLPAAPRGRGLSDLQIQQAVSTQKKDVAECAARAERAGERALGKLSITARVADTGVVEEARVETPSAVGTEFARCVSARVRGWTFPRFSGMRKEEVSMSFIFVPGEG
jgi:hypothetical protein